MPDDTPITDAELAEWQRLHEQCPDLWGVAVPSSPIANIQAGLLVPDSSHQCGNYIPVAVIEMDRLPVVHLAAASRNALPRLIAEVQRLRADLAAAQDVCRQLADRCAGQSEALGRRAERKDTPLT